MDAKTAAAFERLRQDDPSNRFCLECAAPNPQWCALSYGAFICLNCSGAHRGLGVHISFVRSSTMDSWQPLQLQIMKAGGNKRCKDFLVESGVWSLPLRERYCTRAGAYYRALLRAEAEDLPPPPLPMQLWQPADGDAGEAGGLRSSPSFGSTAVRSLGSQTQFCQPGQSGGAQTHEETVSPRKREEEGFIASLQQQAAAASAAAAAAAASVSSSSGAAVETAFQSVSSFVQGARDYTAKTIEAAGETNLLERAKGGIQTGGEWIAEQSKKISTSFGGEDDEGLTAAAQEAATQGSGAASAQASTAAASSRGEAGGFVKRGGSAVLQSMGSLVSGAKEITGRSFSNVSQAVFSNSQVGEGEGGVLEKAREGINSITAAASNWLHPGDVPPAEFGVAEGGGGASGDLKEVF